MISTIELNGRVYPVRFSVRAAINCCKKYGSVDAAIFKSAETETENLERRVFLLHEMMQAGKVWCDQEPEGVDAPEVPSLDELMERVSFAWLAKHRKQMADIVLEEEETEIGAETADDEKN